MSIKYYKPYTPSLRYKSSIDFSFLSKKEPEKTLTKYYHRSVGRNNQGKITTRHKGGGHKRLYRTIDFKRNNISSLGKILSFEYDPYRNVNIALVEYLDSTKQYILCPKFLKINDHISNDINSLIQIGNSLPLERIPLGTDIHNIEIYPNKGGQLVRSAGTFAKILAKEGKYVAIRLPSKEVRLVLNTCRATIGRLSNSDSKNITIGKAGRNRWLGIRPTVRGSAMNPIDHPHGGGEGRSPIGKKTPVTPWGKPTLGFKTRKKNKYSNRFIIHKRK